MSSLSDHQDFVKKNRDNALVFNARVREIALLDRRGKVLWHKKKETPDPIQWNGVDSFGQAVEIGQYTCKIVYEDLQVVYLPFVFMK